VEVTELASRILEEIRKPVWDAWHSDFGVVKRVKIRRLRKVLGLDQGYSPFIYEALRLLEQSGYLKVLKVYSKGTRTAVVILRLLV